MRRSLALLLPALALAACADVENPDHDHENEVVTTVVLTFTPEGGGEALEFTWADPEDDGSPVIDEIVLADGATYALTVAFLNALEDPAEDLTDEIADESDQHQVFITGSAVEGPATGENAAAVISHAYADTDANGAPVGLDNDITALGAGSGELIVTLRHLPEEGGVPAKTEDLAETVAASGFAAIGGDNDAQVTFSLTVE